MRPKSQVARVCCGPFQPLRGSPGRVGVPLYTLQIGGAVVDRALRYRPGLSLMSAYYLNELLHHADGAAAMHMSNLFAHYAGARSTDCRPGRRNAEPVLRRFERCACWQKSVTDSSWMRMWCRKIAVCSPRVENTSTSSIRGPMPVGTDYKWRSPGVQLERNSLAIGTW